LKVNAAYQYRYLRCCPCEEVYFLKVKSHTYKDDYVAEPFEEVQPHTYKDIYLLVY